MKSVTRSQALFVGKILSSPRSPRGTLRFWTQMLVGFAVADDFLRDGIPPELAAQIYRREGEVR